MKTANKTLIKLLFISLFGFSLHPLFAQQNLDRYEKNRNVGKLISVMQVKNNNQNLRQQACAALGRLKDVRAESALIAGLNDDVIRRHAAWALGNIGDKSCINALVAILTDRSSLGREEAAEALDKLGWQPGDNKERAYYYAAKRDWDNCLASGDLAFEPLVYIMCGGPDNARIGAVEALDRSGWTPVSEYREMYDAAKTLKAEKDAVIEKIVRQASQLQVEYEKNLQKLKEDQGSGKLNLSSEEYRLLEERFTHDIMREQEEIKAFRSELNRVGITIAKFDKDTIIGKEQTLGEIVGTNDYRNTGLKVHEEKRGPVGERLIDIWYNIWTGKPAKEFEWKTGNFYRYTHNGDKYLYAKYILGQAGVLLGAEIIEPDGKVSDYIVFSTFNINDPSSRSRIPSWISTIIDQNTIKWPTYIQWAKERCDLIEVIYLGRE